MFGLGPRVIFVKVVVKTKLKQPLARSVLRWDTLQSISSLENLNYSQGHIFLFKTSTTFRATFPLFITVLLHNKQ